MFAYSRFILLALLCFFLACNREDEELVLPSFSPTPMPSPTPISYSFLALGDSYTIGESVAENERWPVQLAARLSEADSVTVTPPRIIARTGWTTDELQTAIAATSDLQPNYDLVSLLIGVNNQYRGQSIEVYRQEFRELLEYAISKARQGRARTFVVSIPDYAYTPFGAADAAAISRGVAQFNAAARQIATELNVPFYNITPISQQGTDQPELVAEDNLHPSGLQYQRWVAEVILEQVRTFLK